MLLYCDRLLSFVDFGGICLNVLSTIPEEVGDFVAI